MNSGRVNGVALLLEYLTTLLRVKAKRLTGVFIGGGGASQPQFSSHLILLYD